MLFKIVRSQRCCGTVPAFQNGQSRNLATLASFQVPAISNEPNVSKYQEIYIFDAESKPRCDCWTDVYDSYRSITRAAPPIEQSFRLP